jgi:hypothetical protein
MHLNFSLAFVLIFFMMGRSAYSQKRESSDYYAGLKMADASKLWYNDIDQPQSDSSAAALPEPLGFIGDNFQRFFIHFITVKKSNANPYQYIITGKTKVKENTCQFSGIIQIVKARLFKEQVDKKYKQGSVECTILFYEDSMQNSTGFFKGKLTSKFYLDERNQLFYDDLEIGADGYRNNQCEALWTSYATRKTKKCNWGDYRIPQCKALDSGDGEFAVNKKYNLFGWKNYRIALSDDPWVKGTGQARKAEKKHWWE